MPEFTSYLNKTSSAGKPRADWLDSLLTILTYVFVAALPISIALTQTTLFLLWAFWLVKCIRNGRWEGWSTPIDIPLAVFLVAYLLATVFSPKFLESLAGLKKIYLLTAVYLIPFLVQSFIKWKKLASSFLVSTLASAVWGLLDINGVPHLTVSSHTMQLTVSGILMMACAFSLGFLLPFRGKIVRYIPNIMLTSGSALFLLLTHKLSSLLALLASFILFLALTRKRLLLGISLIILTGGAIAVFHQPQLALQRSDAREQKSWSWQQRSIIWKTGWEIIKDRPIFGHGIIDLSDYYANKRKSIGIPPPVDFNRSFGHLHNNFLQIWAISGIFGLAAFIYLMYKILFVNIKSFFLEKSDTRYYVLGIVAAQVAFLVNGLAEWNFGDSEVVTVFWVLTGLGLAFKKLTDFAKIAYKRTIAEKD